ncbi:hypothetical protein BZA05DRAFT_415677 [Tricharina praecox]|uniref:uncharacterized protein n=1 Tax=Tricharina praecox TaxID=43433 RepID=UPI00221E435D|nr:uncharacterized protein BZA05DRAFT_415677 [Tricharina praecox]KAI5856961.1 hypothetical protein BZA05DRAFT_415677 [Tricharina praecox]
MAWWAGGGGGGRLWELWCRLAGGRGQAEILRFPWADDGKLVHPPSRSEHARRMVTDHSTLLLVSTSHPSQIGRYTDTDTDTQGGVDRMDRVDCLIPDNHAYGNELAVDGGSPKVWWQA